MTKRGRPRYPDILTPRESEVLALLREGLTNAQISERLGVSRDGVKYHVSEILSKLGVATRQQAAEWRPEEARRWWLAGLALLLRPLEYVPFLGTRAVAGSVIGSALAGIGFLVWGLIVTGGPASPDAQTLATDSQTPAALDASPTGIADRETPTPLHVVPREPAEAIVVYLVPPPPGIQDGTAYARVIDLMSGTAGGEDRLVGSFLPVKPVYGNSPDASLDARILVGSIFTERPQEEIALDRDGVSQLRTIDPADIYNQGSPGPAVLDARGITYNAEARRLEGPDEHYSKRIVATDSSGAVVASYPLPRALPITDPDRQLQCGEPTSGVYILDELDVADSLLISGEGHPLVFVSNTVNTALVDLVTEQRLDLPGYLGVTASTMGVDGYVYAVMRRCKGLDVLAQIDPKNMQLKQLAETIGGWSSEWNTTSASLTGTPDGGIYFYTTLSRLVQLPDDYEQINVLQKLDQSKSEMTSIAVPDDLGLNVTVGVDGKVYFYGGPAESTVSAYDPVTGEWSFDLPELRAPAGTYIRALFVR